MSETEISRESTGQGLLNYFDEWWASVDWLALQQAIENTAVRLWEILRTPGSEFWSAIAGAVVGGLIAYWIQVKSLKEARNERDNERLQAEKSLAYSLLFKVIKIHNSLEHIRRHVETLKALHGSSTQPSGYLLPLANLPSAVEFSPDEMSMLLSLRNDDLFNLVLSLDNIHNSIIPVWEYYAASRETVKQLTHSIQFDPELGRSEFEVKKDSPLSVAIFEAEQIARELIKRAYRDATEAKQALDNLVSFFRSRFGFTISIVNAEKSAEEQGDVSAAREQSPQTIWPGKLQYNLHYNTAHRQSVGSSGQAETTA
ncbi:hypothetical protein [Sinorhizobium chiapasense]|uniref:Uncharacterized protein n=1 Tax=Sinorhizobium chiapasense TaxID=501572 RepID=A0ABZ2BCU8_9HYPH